MSKGDYVKRFFEGVLCGLGGVSPGLSGSVLLIIFGLYNKTIEAIATIFKKPKENIKFLLPLGAGILVGVKLFGDLVSYLLDNFEMVTRLTFLGLILGTIPLLYKNVKQKGINKKNYLLIAVSFIIGTLFLYVQKTNTQLVSANYLQSFGLGIILAASTIIPGVDSAVVLSSMGLYEIFISAIHNLTFSVLIPALVGGGLGIIAFSALINYLIKNYYTVTYSIIFGLFLSITPSVLNSSVQLGLDIKTFISIILLVLGFILSYKLSKLSED